MEELRQVTSSIVHLAATIHTVAYVLTPSWEPHMTPAQTVERGDLVGLVEHHLERACHLIAQLCLP